MMDYIEQERKKQIEIIGKQEEANQNIEKEITTPLDEAQNLSKLDLKMRKKLDKLAKCTPTKKGNISMATKTPKSPNHNETKTSFEIETYSKLRKKQEFLNLIGSSHRYEFNIDLSENSNIHDDTFKLTKSGEDILKYLPDDFVKLLNDKNEDGRTKIM